MPKYYEIKINSLNLLTMEQQTAVDWFFENIKSYFTKDWDVFEDIVFTMSIAKLKEKQQIIDAVLFGDSRGKNKTYLTSEEYYNEKFKKTKNGTTTATSN